MLWLELLLLLLELLSSLLLWLTLSEFESDDDDENSWWWMCFLFCSTCSLRSTHFFLWPSTVSDDESHGGFSGKQSSGSSPLHRSTSWNRVPVKSVARPMHLSTTRPLMRAVRSVTTARSCSYLLTLLRLRSERKKESELDDDDDDVEVDEEDEESVEVDEEESVDDDDEDDDGDELDEDEDDDELDEDELDDDDEELDSSEYRGASSWPRYWPYLTVVRESELSLDDELDESELVGGSTGTDETDVCPGRPLQ